MLMSNIKSEVKIILAIAVSTIICFGAAIGVALFFELEVIDAVLCGFIACAINNCIDETIKKHSEECKSKESIEA